MSAKEKLRAFIDEPKEAYVSFTQRTYDTVKTIAFPFMVLIVVFFLKKEDARLDKVDTINNNVNDLKAQITSLRDEVREQRDSILGAEKAHILELKLELERSGVHLKDNGFNESRKENPVDFNNPTPVAEASKPITFKNNNHETMVF